MKAKNIWFVYHKTKEPFICVCIYIKDKFVRKAEHSITNSKKGTVTVRAGYYTEEEMKSTLKWPECLIVRFQYMCVVDVLFFLTVGLQTCVFIPKCSKRVFPFKVPGESCEALLHEDAQETTWKNTSGQYSVYIFQVSVLICLSLNRWISL